MPERKKPVLLDGPLGTQLEARGLVLGAPLWSGAALLDAPELLAGVHRDYAEAGATHHTTATFRTAGRPSLTERAVRSCRRAVPPEHTVLGSMAPIADCYRPWETPENTREHHRAHAHCLAGAGVDGLLVETFAHPREAVEAVEEAVSTGLPTWCALTAGPSGSLHTATSLAALATRVIQAGASVVLVNCTGLDRILVYCEALASLGVPWGCYPNAGPMDGPHGWGSGAGSCRPVFEAIAALEPDVVGACCGMGPAHVALWRAIVEG